MVSRFRVAIVMGVRTPFCKAQGLFKGLQADDLGAFAVRELLVRSGLAPTDFDQLVFGNVLQPPEVANIARVISIKGGLSEKVPAFTVNRNCASGMEALVSAARLIEMGESKIAIAGGTESMSNFPLLYKDAMRDFLVKLSKARGWKQKIASLAAFRPSLLMPKRIQLADPLCGLSMGQTAERLVREFKISRRDQELFALASQQRASAARKSGRLAEEIVPVPMAPAFSAMQSDDDGPRDGQTIESMEKLSPAFEKGTGTVTAGTSSQVTDGAVALLLMSPEEAAARGLTPLGYLRGAASAGLQPERMGLGPAFAIAKLLKIMEMPLEAFDLIEINEAFAAQVLAVLRALESETFAREELGLEQPPGKISPEKLNVNGGAVALGHPLGASGARLVLTLLLELKRRKKRWGIASLCVGGGQGQAVALEVANNV